MNISISQEAYSGATIIESMPRKDFHLKIVKGIGQMKAFGALVSFKAENISPEEKQEIRVALNGVGVPLTMMESDCDLNEIAAVVSARAVALR